MYGYTAYGAYGTLYFHKKLKTTDLYCVQFKRNFVYTNMQYHNQYVIVFYITRMQNECLSGMIFIIPAKMHDIDGAFCAFEDWLVLYLAKMHNILVHF